MNLLTSSYTDPHSQALKKLFKADKKSSVYICRVHGQLVLLISVLADFVLLALKNFADCISLVVYESSTAQQFVQQETTQQ